MEDETRGVLEEAGWKKAHSPRRADRMRRDDRGRSGGLWIEWRNWSWWKPEFTDAHYGTGQVRGCRLLIAIELGADPSAVCSAPEDIPNLDGRRLDAQRSSCFASGDHQHETVPSTCLPWVDRACIFRIKRGLARFRVIGSEATSRGGHPVMAVEPAVRSRSNRRRLARLYA